MNRRILGPAVVALAIMAVILGGLIWLLAASHSQKDDDSSSISKLSGADNLQFGELDLTPSKEIVGGDLAVTGQLTVSDGLSSSSLVITPSDPTSPAVGQLYVTSDNNLHYFDGSDDIVLSQIGQLDDLATQVGQLNGLANQVGQLNGLSGQLGTLQQLLDAQSDRIADNEARVTSLQGQTGDLQINSGPGIDVSGTTISNTGVLSCQGRIGDVTLTAGSGIAVNGTTVSNTGLTGLNGLTGGVVIQGTAGQLAVVKSGQNLRFQLDPSVSLLGQTISNSELENSSLAVFAGNGLIGSGVASLGGGVTVSVGAGDGISVSNDTIAVDSTVCRTSGNCVGTGGAGSAIGGSGTTGQIAVFDSPGTIASSIISQNLAGDTITVTGTLTATALQGDGSGLTNVDALTLQGEGKSYFTDAGNLASGTLSDARLSSNVAFYNAGTANFTGTLQQNGDPVCTTAGNCGGITGSGGLNYLTKFDSSGNLVTSLIYDDGTSLGVGTTTPGYLLDVQGGTGVV
ncbi:MAG TPA: hypothetical protein VFG56_02365, partial [Candidatus Saccharimonadales bacterium]|nr:hypothetical protein [Candidatus Saccharimonadales bacterium]